MGLFQEILLKLKEGKYPTIGGVMPIAVTISFKFVNFYRLLLPVKPVYAASVGTIRAYSRSKKTCYVEPSKVSSQCNDLVLLRSEIEETEKNISNDLMKSIISVSPTIWRGVCLLGRLGRSIFMF